MPYPRGQGVARGDLIPRTARGYRSKGPPNSFLFVLFIGKLILVFVFLLFSKFLFSKLGIGPVPKMGIL